MSWQDPLLQSSDGHEESFWPSFTDIMMVILMAFLLVTVAVVLSNTRLLKDLRSSVAAEQQASQLAEFTLKENATLEEQLDYYRRQLASTEMELLKNRADLEATRTELGGLNQQATLQASQLAQRATQISRLEQDLSTSTREAERLESELQQSQAQLGRETTRLERALQQAEQERSAETERLGTELQQAQTALAQSLKTLDERDTTLSELRAQIEAGREQLASLEGNYADLDKKYQKLLKPTRSDKGKVVVEVLYQRSGHSIRKPGEANYRSVSTAELDRELAALKASHGNELYVKIIIPENSGLSYNQAWLFTRDTLAKYDYYYQEESSRPAANPVP